MIVLGNLSCRQFRLRFSPLKFVFLLIGSLLPALLGCRTSINGTYRGETSSRVIEFRSASAYISEGGSTQAVPYEVSADRIVLKMPFMNIVLRRMPDGSLSGMGETMVRVEDIRGSLVGNYESSGGEYQLRLSAQGHAVYTRLGRSIDGSYSMEGNILTLHQGTIRISIERRPDGSLETPDAVLKKQS